MCEPHWFFFFACVDVSIFQVNLFISVSMRETQYESDDS